VVYVVDPGPLAPTGAAPTAPQELLRCAVPLLRAAKDLPHLNIAFQILPTALLLEPWYIPRQPHRPPGRPRRALLTCRVSCVVLRVRVSCRVVVGRGRA
jgi:hypothetical protein